VSPGIRSRRSSVRAGQRILIVQPKSAAQ